MIRIVYSVFAFTLLVVFSCEPKKSDKGISSEDTLKEEKAVTADTSDQASSQNLSGKAGMISGKWKATEFETPTVKLSGELTDIRFDFKNDMTFDYSEDGKKDGGTWKLNEKEDQISLTFQNDIKADMDIKELTENKMVIAGKQHGMYRTYVLERVKK
jgi:hypothetical protein